jgi:hypothetical protein
MTKLAFRVTAAVAFALALLVTLYGNWISGLFFLSAFFGFTYLANTQGVKR